MKIPNVPNIINEINANNVSNITNTVNMANTSDNSNISIVGTGYVGLVTGVCLAAKGHKVICVDNQEIIVNKLSKGQATIYEPRIDNLLKEVISKGNFSVTNDIVDAVMNTDISIVAVGTPFKAGKIDLSYIEQSVREIGSVLKSKEKYHVVCIKSTVVPTTTDTLVKNILEEVSGKKAGTFGLAMNPEFLREGKAVDDFMNPDRIVIGAYDKESFEVIRKIYEGYFKAPIIWVNLRAAEMIKYASNSLLAALISYSNEIASICEEVGGIDVKEVLEAVTLDKRFNPRIGDVLTNPEMIKYVRAGCGFGGSCFPKDVKALVSFADDMGYSANMLKSVLSINEVQPLRLVAKLETAVNGLQDKKIVVLGVAFKPDTDDIRESPSLTVIKELLRKKARVTAVDPIAVKNANKAIPGDGINLCYSSNYRDALKDVDGAVLITNWSEFSAITAEEFIMLMKKPVLVDGRCVYNKQAMISAGVKYFTVGLTDTAVSLIDSATGLIDSADVTSNDLEDNMNIE